MRSEAWLPLQLIETLDRAELGLMCLDAGQRVVHLNATLRRWAGEPTRPGPWIRGANAPLDWPRLWLEGGQCRVIVRAADGGERLLALQAHARDAQGIGLVLLRPLDGDQERESIATLQEGVLAAIAEGRTLPEVLDLLCREVESLAPGVWCSVLSLDGEGRLHPLAAPTLPEAWSAAIDGVAIGPDVGSCGTAAWRRSAVEVSDIAHDPLWTRFAPLALSFGLAACWSTPILAADGEVVATFALYYPRPQPVAAFHRRMVQASVRLCQVAFRQARHERDIERLAFTDPTTGLANRRLLGERAAQALAIAERTGAPSALLLLDLDRFKTLNDALSHTVGDVVLRRIGDRLHHLLRDTDTLARVGGDEFAVLLPGCSAEDALQVAEKLLAELRGPLREQALDTLPGLTLTASAGIACSPADGGDLDALLRNAEIAMYEAKHEGGDRARYFHPAMNEAIDEQLALELDLRRALQEGRLQLHYQPQVALRDGRLIGVEALMRWPDPQRGLVPPDRFIPLAEQCGLINELDAWALSTACAQMAAWRAQGLAVPNVAVNASARRFTQDDIAAEVATLLQRHRIDAASLTIEITERLLLDDNPRARAQLEQLHRMGVRLSVDDFGTGYSSLSYLKRLPLSEIQLDRSFVRDLETDPDDRALAGAVIGIGRALGLAVVAEGVETEAQRALLEQAQCHAVQGWLFARPMPAGQLASWLQQRPATAAAPAPTLQA